MHWRKLGVSQTKSGSARTGCLSVVFCRRQCSPSSSVCITYEAKAMCTQFLPQSILQLREHAGPRFAQALDWLRKCRHICVIASLPSRLRDMYDCDDDSEPFTLANRRSETCCRLFWALAALSFAIAMALGQQLWEKGALACGVHAYTARCVTPSWNRDLLHAARRSSPPMLGYPKFDRN